MLEVIEDPILFGEFLRNTADGSPIKEEHPKRKFEYRWYQKDLLTDLNTHIVVRGGRVIGKCSPDSARIYTTEGYQTIGELRKKNRGVFAVYTLTDDGDLVQRRARVELDGVRAVWSVHTSDGKIFKGTAEHPVLTQRGWVPIKKLNKDEDRVAVMTHLPWDSIQNYYNWYELRILGYMFATSPELLGAETPIRVTYQQQSVEMHMIAKALNCKLVITDDGYQLFRKGIGPHKHYVNMLLSDCDEHMEFSKRSATRIPSRIMKERLENIKLFLEAYLSMAADITATKTTVQCLYENFAEDLQEALLRFGIETRITAIPLTEEENKTRPVNQRRLYRYVIETYDDYAQAQLLTSFDIPGVTVRNIPVLPRPDQAHTAFRFEKIDDIIQESKQKIYAIFVYEHHNYISDNMMVHNSLWLQDLMVYETVNEDIMFPDTKEQTLATANTNQITPILDGFVNRFLNGKLLKAFAALPNKSKGTIDFQVGSRLYRVYARIAGSRGENNMVGLHVNKIKIDEAQIFPWAAYIQLLPTLNRWESRTQMLFTGVPNGNINGSVLWHLDQKADEYKKYRIPAHENPFYTEDEHTQDLIRYGGENSNEYMQLILGQHGNPMFTIIPRENILFEPYEFFSYRYHQNDKQMGQTYSDAFKLPKIPEELRRHVVFAIDSGYADPTIIQVMGRDDRGTWRTLVRYRMQRIPFPEQAIVIDWLDEYWKPSSIGIDIGAGGGGITIMQTLQSDQFKRHRQYQQKIYGIRFGDTVVTGPDPRTGDDLKFVVKSWAGMQLAKVVGEHELVFSELDHEGTNELERVTYQKRADGSMKFFVLSQTGHGEASEDHIFASYVVFVTMLSLIDLQKPMKKLFKATWV